MNDSKRDSLYIPDVLLNQRLLKSLEDGLFAVCLMVEE